MINALSRAFRFLVSGPYPILTTWVLWRQFFNPAFHPLYWQLHQDSSALKFLMRLKGPMLLAAQVVGCGLCCLLMPLTASLLSPLFVILLFLSTSLYVSVWIIDITQALIREHRQGTYDLLCAAPAGAMSVNQAICAASLHRYNSLIWIHRIRQLGQGFLLFVLLLLVPIATSYRKPEDDIQFWRPFLDVIALIVAAYLDHVQTVVLGCLVAMLVPAKRPHHQDASLIAVGVFFVIQMLIFLLTGLAITLLGIVFQPTGWATFWVPVLNLLVFYLIRETFNIVLWKELVAQLDVSPTESQVLA